MQCHIWDVFGAPRASASEVRSKLKNGWGLYSLPETIRYCSAGGVGQYEHVLASQEGELRQVTVKAVASACPNGVGDLEELTVIIDVVPLEVPFAEKEAVKALGAKWVGHARKWCVKAGDTERFAQWLPANGQMISVVQGEG